MGERHKTVPTVGEHALAQASRKRDRHGRRWDGLEPHPDVPSPAELERLSRANRRRPRGAGGPFAAAAPGPLITGGLNLPERYDWRSVNGQDFIGPARISSRAGRAWRSRFAAWWRRRFASHAMTRRTRSIWRRLTCSTTWGTAPCAAAWNPPEALEAVRTTGVVDEACRPYAVGGSGGGPLCANWEARVHRITGAQSVFGMDQLLRWIATRGPLVAPYNVYDDFNQYLGGVYRQQSQDFIGQHALCIVGYDEPDACWIVKNSFGPAWGEDNGFARIAWGECGIDAIMWGVLGVVE